MEVAGILCFAIHQDFSWKMRVGIICESFSGSSSGGRAAMCVADALRLKNYEVFICVTSSLTSREDSGTQLPVFYLAEKNEFLKLADKLLCSIHLRIASRFSRYIQTLLLKRRFQSWYKTNKIQVAHFASFNTDKPASFIESLKKNGVTILLQPWIHAYACAQGYGFRKDQECTECFSGGFTKSIRFGCSGVLKGCAESLLRSRLQKVATHGCYFLASSEDMLQKLVAYGAMKSAVHLLPLPFKTGNLLHTEPEDEGYFLFYSASLDYKGLSVLSYLFKHAMHINFRVLPMRGQEHFFVEWQKKISPTSKLEIISSTSWNTSVPEMVRKSRAVLVPSLWPVTPEYVLLESMAMAKPVIAFNIGCHKTFLQDRENAMVVEPGNFGDFLKRIDELNSDSNLARQIGCNARLAIKITYGATKWEERIGQVYSAILSRNHNNNQTHENQST